MSAVSLAVYGDYRVTMHSVAHARDRHGQLTSGACPYFIISRIFNHLNFEIPIGGLPYSTIYQILPVNSLEHKEQLYFLDQLQNPTELQVINSGTNSNLNFPRFLKEFWTNLINSLKFHLHMLFLNLNLH
jgi:hypothetical protein